MSKELEERQRYSYIVFELLQDTTTEPYLQTEYEEVAYNKLGFLRIAHPTRNFGIIEIKEEE